MASRFESDEALADELARDVRELFLTAMRRRGGGMGSARHETNQVEAHQRSDLQAENSYPASRNSFDLLRRKWARAEKFWVDIIEDMGFDVKVMDKVDTMDMGSKNGVLKELSGMETMGLFRYLDAVLRYVPDERVSKLERSTVGTLQNRIRTLKVSMDTLKAIWHNREITFDQAVGQSTPVLDKMVQDARDVNSTFKTYKDQIWFQSLLKTLNNEFHGSESSFESHVGADGADAEGDSHAELWHTLKRLSTEIATTHARIERLSGACD